MLVNPALGKAGVYDYVAHKVGDCDMVAQVTAQAWAVGTTLIWSGVVAFISFKMIIDLVIDLRVTEEVEREGLDTTEHGESAYHH